MVTVARGRWGGAHSHCQAPRKSGVCVVTKLAEGTVRREDRRESEKGNGPPMALETLRCQQIGGR